VHVLNGSSIGPAVLAQHSSWSYPKHTDHGTSVTIGRIFALRACVRCGLTVYGRGDICRMYVIPCQSADTHALQPVQKRHIISESAERIHSVLSRRVTCNQPAVARDELISRVKGARGCQGEHVTSQRARRLAVSCHDSPRYNRAALVTRPARPETPASIYGERKHARAGAACSPGLIDRQVRQVRWQRRPITAQRRQRGTPAARRRRPLSAHSNERASARIYAIRLGWRVGAHNSGAPRKYTATIRRPLASVIQRMSSDAGATLFGQQPR